MRPSITYTLLLILCSLATTTSAREPTSLVKREDANSPYILESYSCDLSRLKRRENGTTFGRVETSPSSIAVAVTPEAHEAVIVAGTRRFLSYMNDNPEVKHIKSKVKQFESDGNIPAMKHWDEKLRAEYLYRESYFRQLTILEYISSQNSQGKLPVYYTPNRGLKLYSTFEEMDADYENYCNFGVLRRD